MKRPLKHFDGSHRGNVGRSVSVLGGLFFFAWAVTAGAPEASSPSTSRVDANAVMDSVTVTAADDPWPVQLDADIAGSSNTDVGQAAPDQIIDRGVCPYEMCRYGERWLARQDVNAFNAPPDRFGAPPESLGVATVIRKGTWVTTITGLVIAKQHQGRVISGTSYGGGGASGPSLRSGQVLAIYSYLGEGCVSSWIEGRFYVVCMVEAEPTSWRQEWWVQVRTAAGRTVWLLSKAGSLVSQEALNSELGQAIADDKLPLSAKRSKVELLIAEGADLNGDVGRYGTSSLQAVISSNDVGLLQMLLSKGLNLRARSNGACPAWNAMSTALQPGGSVMLETLLDNGLQLGCLPGPPLESFLRMGIASESYPIERAIEVAEVLVKHGAEVDQRDAQGKSILDILADPQWASRVAPLRAALVSMASASPAQAVGTCQLAQGTLPTPAFPVIFVHGIASNADEAWGDLRDALVTCGWAFGGRPEVLLNAGLVGFANMKANFYTMNMSDWRATTYPSQSLTFEQQGLQLASVIQKVRTVNGVDKVIVVGHSMGGLAARAYMQSLGKNVYAHDVYNLITIGTPHKGSPMARLTKDLVLQPVSWIRRINPQSVAVSELQESSSTLRILNDQRGPVYVGATSLPSDSVYVTIAAVKTLLGAPTADLGSTDTGDGVGSLSSQTFLPPSPAQHIVKKFEIPCRPSDIEHLVDCVQVHTRETRDEAIRTELLEQILGLAFSRQVAARAETGMQFVKIAAGEYLMGCSTGDNQCSNQEKPQHRVRIAREFEIGKYEVTQTEWTRVMGTNPSHYRGDNYPVDSVSWNDVQAFIAKMNARNDGFRYRLPTEAEWEYAARAGTTGPYAGTSDAPDWFDPRTGEQPTHPVAQKQPNAWGLYDTRGNVWEWMQDVWSNDYSSSPPPEASDREEGRVLRGGPCYQGSPPCASRVSARIGNGIGQRNVRMGFRCLRERIR